MRDDDCLDLLGRLGRDDGDDDDAGDAVFAADPADGDDEGLFADERYMSDRTAVIADRWMQRADFGHVSRNQKSIHSRTGIGQQGFIEDRVHRTGKPMIRRAARFPKSMKDEASLSCRAKSQVRSYLPCLIPLLNASTNPSVVKQRILKREDNHRQV